MYLGNGQNVWNWIAAGGMTLGVLGVCSLMIWSVILERIWIFWRFEQDLNSFHLSAVNAILMENESDLKRLCASQVSLPTAQLLALALERIQAKDARVRKNWPQAYERKRLSLNQDLRSKLWVLGTLGSAAPFIGLFGTVVGILKSFGQIAQVGAGGFSVVAAGISESLIATAAGIIVAVIAVLAFNAFQVQWSRWVLVIRNQSEELADLLHSSEFLTQKKSGE